MSNINSVFEIAAEMVSQRTDEQLRQRSNPSQRQRQNETDSKPAITTASADGASDGRVPAPSKTVSSSMEIITGLVTHMQDMFGMVSGEIFFQAK